MSLDRQTAPSPTPPVWQRVELKFGLPEALAREAARYVQPFVSRDRAGGDVACQRVDSLYLDTPRMDFYRAHVADVADRFKLRVRWYGDEAGPLAYLEVKRKVGHVVHKRRARLARERVAGLLEGRCGLPADSGEGHAHVRLFVSLAALHRATPVLLTTCRREAFCSRQPGCSARVTFDREMAYQPASRLTLDGRPGRWRRTPAPGAALLELKYSGDPPSWMRELALRLGRFRVAYSKYVAAVTAWGGEAEPWRVDLGVPA